VCISEDYPGIQLVFQPFEPHALYRALCTHRHKNGRFDYRTPRLYYSCSGLTVACGYLEVYRRMHYFEGGSFPSNAQMFEAPTPVSVTISPFSLTRMPEG